MPRKPTTQSKSKMADNQPVKDFDYTVKSAGSVALAKFAQKNGGLIGAMGGANGFSRGDIEKQLLKKGMTKAQAAKELEKNGAAYMNGAELMQARQKEQERLRERRDKFDLQVESKDLYGGKTKDNAFEINGDDLFGAYGDEDALENDPGYQRLENGMVINENTDEAKKQNAAIIKAGAKIAMGGNQTNVFEDMQDSRSISEYYAELFSYAPAILSEAIRNGNTYERFKLSIKFAFSIIHCMALQDVI